MPGGVARIDAVASSFQRAVLRFYRRRKRDLPWRRTHRPYRILVSEIMLQQTQVERVIPKYRSFLARFPTIHTLAQARFADVLREWLGLGYNSRALRLWQCARVVVRDYGGKLPADVDTLVRLPGIGPYTAAALAAIAYGAHVPVVDVNVRRVLVRALTGRNHASAPKVSQLARQALPASSAAEWAQALMDVGAMFCKATPECSACPVRRSCAFVRTHGGGWVRTTDLKRVQHARRTGSFVGSTRFFRGRVMRALSERGDMRVNTLGREVKEGFGVSDGAWLYAILAGLERDGLIQMERARKMVRLP
jgi:A/G-specific adenine glycosylase